jgi:hypothetical protein
VLTNGNDIYEGVATLSYAVVVGAALYILFNLPPGVLP